MRLVTTCLLAVVIVPGCGDSMTSSGGSGGSGDATSGAPPPDPVTPAGTTSGSVPATSGGVSTTAVEPADDTTTSTPSPSTTTTTTATPSTTTGDGPTTTTTGDATTTTGDDSTTSTTGDETTTGETTGAQPWMPQPCPSIYDQNLLPTFELEVAPDELAKLKKEWSSQNKDKPKHPLKKFKYEDIEITNASIELRGNPKWWPGQKKMQFEISFNTYDKKGRFFGLKSILFDAAEYNLSYLRDRLALQIMRDVGLPAPCANNARVVLNGQYYGLYTNVEKVDSEFLERYFEFPDGNLYKRDDWEKKNNEEDKDDSDIEDLVDAKNIAELDKMMNLEEAILEWATEAVLPDNDGAWAGGLNYFVYNDPQTGFNIIPWDKDATFTRVEHTIDPYTYIKPNDHGRPFYKIATDDPYWFGKYIEAIAFVLENGYDVELQQKRIKDWAAQIKTAAKEDPNRPFSFSEHQDKIKEKLEYVKDRHKFVSKWLQCWQDGGVKDGKGNCKSN